MDHLDRPLPFFVYGTLRPGHGNYDRLLRGRTTRERPAVVRGHHLYVRGVPYAVPTGRVGHAGHPGLRDHLDASVPAPPLVGALIDVAPALYREVLADLDALEGYHPADLAGSLYRRVRTPRVTAQTLIRPGATSTFPTHHRAWIYIAGDGFDPRTATRVPSGYYEHAGAELTARRRGRRE